MRVLNLAFLLALSSLENSYAQSVPDEQLLGSKKVTEPIQIQQRASDDEIIAIYNPIVISLAFARSGKKSNDPRVIEVRRGLRILRPPGGPPPDWEPDPTFLRCTHLGCQL